MSKTESHNKENDKTDTPEVKPSAKGNTPESLRTWLSELTGAGLVEWDRLPDIELYMDQVLTLMERQLAFYRRSEEDKLLTQPMINNYTKDGLLPRATDKKYAKGHLALLSILCSLKPVLSISDLSTLLQTAMIDNNEKDLYDFFLRVQSDAIDANKIDLSSKLDEMKISEDESELTAADRRDLALMALRMSVEARARIMLTQKILDLVHEKSK